MEKNIFIGTSGYNYNHWSGAFYPKDLPSGRWLEFYTQYFKTVELNVTFYRTPLKKVFATWYKKTQKDFKFVVKGSRFITHIKKLNECEEPLKYFFDNACGLKEKLLCVLWQFPPSLRNNLKKLASFLEILKKNYSFCLHSFEFREKTWFNPETYSLLKENNMNLCLADSPDFPSEETITSSFLYLRFHGGKILYGSEYSEKELNQWADKAKKLRKKNGLLLAFFNNDAYGFAVKNALRFTEILNEKL